MGRKLDEYNKKTIKFFGFKFERKLFWITMGIAIGVILMLIALSLFGVNVSWYGVLFGLGFLVALALAGQLCPERQLDSEFPYTLIWWVFPCSLIGARLYFLIFNGSLNSFMDIIRIWDGGLAVYGGVIGGLIGLIICCIIKKVNIISTTDIVVPLLALGQAFGRIGCIFGNCCYGVEVTNRALQWFPISIYVDGAYHFATNFYESMFDLALFFVLVIILRKCKIKGITTFSYMVGYGLVRYILEAFRAEKQTLFAGSTPVSQIVSIMFVVIGAIGISVLLIVNNRKSSKSSI